MSMFCFQCEQTAKGTGCTHGGVCGKKESSAQLQDLILFTTKKLCIYYAELLKKGIKNKTFDHIILDALFSTVTNVNFNDESLIELLRKIVEQKNIARNLCKKNGVEIIESECFSDEPCNFDLAQMLSSWEKISIEARKQNENIDKLSLEEMLTYGLKGTAAYAHHAHVLGFEDDEIYAFFVNTLTILAKNSAEIDELLNLNLKCGEINLKTMELLDKANTQTYGDPEPTSVRITPIKGKAILVSGHDLKDLAQLLEQTKEMGINIYTHGEMLPCNAYPALRKYKHLVGNYGGAWQDQQKEFAKFPGAILMTTNCIQNPKGINWDYSDKIFTTGPVQYEGVEHVENGKFQPVIDKALALKGFSQDEEEKLITIGFGHNVVASILDTLVGAIKSGQIRHFFLIGGCDGAKSGRNYYTEFAQKVPHDCVILTLACGKFRFNKLEFGDIGGIPRLLDVGQCNDAYSAIQIATALAKAFDTDINNLPLSFILSWYEQKAVCILLTLLFLGIKNMRLGPSLPAFISPNVLNILVEKFNIMPITTPDADLKAILG